MARLGLVVLNTGNTSTFRRPGYRERIADVTFASESIAPRVSAWLVLQDYTASDHQYIIFHKRASNATQHSNWKTARWNVKIDEEKFATALHDGLTGVAVPAANESRPEVEVIVTRTMDLLEKVSAASMPQPRHKKPEAYWWTEEIADLRRACLQLRR